MLLCLKNLSTALSLSLSIESKIFQRWSKELSKVWVVLLQIQLDGGGAETPEGKTEEKVSDAHKLFIISIPARDSCPSIE